uniref:Uncharacterized protein n=1 Tax=Setaria italica TaxID=4555 RepID=K3YYQ2_SETIT
MAGPSDASSSLRDLGSVRVEEQLQQLKGQRPSSPVVGKLTPRDAARHKPPPHYTFLLDVLHGRELCLTASTNETMLTIWTLPVVDKGLNSPWERRYSINVSGLFHTMALPPCSSGIILWRAEAIYRYNLVTCKLTTLCDMDRMAFQGRRERKWKDLFTFDVKPYTESLVRITNHLC